MVLVDDDDDVVVVFFAPRFDFAPGALRAATMGLY